MDPDPPQTFKNSLQLRSVQFLASCARQMPRCSLNTTLNHECGTRVLFSTQRPGFMSQEERGHVPPLATQNRGFVSLDALPLLRHKTKCVVSQARGACRLCHTADMSAVLSKQTGPPCHTADMSAVLHSRRVCGVAQQTCLLCDTADMSAVLRSWIALQK